MFPPWGFTKILTEDDVSGSLELSDDDVYTHIFRDHPYKAMLQRLSNDGLVPIVMTDMNTGSQHDVMLQRLAYHDKFVIHGWFQDFVTRRGLTKGMTIGIYSDPRGNIRFTLIN